MDPFSITASAVTLIEAAGFATKSLYAFAHALRTADTRLNSLYDALMQLTEFLNAVTDALKNCRPFDLANVDEELWRQTDSAMMNCQITLSELNSLIQKIKDGARSTRFGRRVKVVTDLSIYGREIAAFHDRIHKSNWALQTILHTINISLSMRNNAGQRLILDELERLRHSISEALRISCQPAGGFSHGCTNQSDARVARNLKDLANAAKAFYSTASSAASTSHGEDSITAWRQNGSSVAARSVEGTFSPTAREMVEKFVQEGLIHATKDTDSISCSSRSPTSPIRTNDKDVDDKNLDVDDDEDEDKEFEREYVHGLQRLAMESIKSFEFDKACDALRRALGQRSTWDSANTAKDVNISTRSLKTQLSICYFLQGSWKLAEDIVVELASSKRDRDIVVCNLLHALALGYLSEYSFEKALKTCHQAVQGKKKLLKANETEDSSSDYSQSLGLLAMIFEMTDDYIRAEVHRRQLPLSFTYSHPIHGGEYLAKHKSFISAAFPTDTPDLSLTDMAFSASSPSSTEQSRTGFDNRESGSSQVCSQPQSRMLSPKQLSTLQVKFDQHRRLENDTSKEVSPIPLPSPSDECETSLGGDPDSSDSDELPSPMRRTLTRILSTMTLRRTELAEESDDDSSVSSSTNRVPLITRWSVRVGRQLFGPKTSSNLLRKKPKNRKIFARSAMRHKAKVQRQTSSVDIYAWDDDKGRTHRGYYAPQTPLRDDCDFTVADAPRETHGACGSSVWRQLDTISSTTPERVPRVGANPYSPDSFGYSELHDEDIRELPNTSPLPELSMYPRTPISARTRRVHFAPGLLNQGVANRTHQNGIYTRRNAEGQVGPVAELDTLQPRKARSGENLAMSKVQHPKDQEVVTYHELDTTRVIGGPDQTPSPVDLGSEQLGSAESCHEASHGRYTPYLIGRKPITATTTNSQPQASEISLEHCPISQGRGTLNALGSRYEVEELQGRALDSCHGPFLFASGGFESPQEQSFSWEPGSELDLMSDGGVSPASGSREVSPTSQGGIPGLLKKKQVAWAVASAPEPW